MIIPSANDMASAIRQLIQILQTNNLIESSSVSSVSNVMTQLKRIGDKRSWNYSIDASSPIIFKAVLHDKIGKHIKPKIYMDVEVDEKLIDKKIPPFSKLTSVLEVITDSNILQRFHIDLSSKKIDKTYQKAPLFHLQAGGHSPLGDRNAEFKLSEPRLLHPPMDVVLLSEVIVANFYPNEWKRIKSQPGWSGIICDSQKLCYSFYFEVAKKCLDSSSSLLCSLWASNWDDVS